MTDIVQRLRGKFLVGSVDDSLDPLLNEAADEIERLRHDAAIQEEMTDVKIQKYNELVAVLEKIADLGHGSAAALARSALDTMEALNQ